MVATAGHLRIATVHILAPVPGAPMMQIHDYAN